MVTAVPPPLQGVELSGLSAAISHFLNCFAVPQGSRIFLISTALYEPYQTYSLLPLAIEYGVELEFVGCDYKKSDDEILATLCLQDLKSAVNAMTAFTRRYENCPE